MKLLVSFCLVGTLAVGCAAPQGSARYVEKDGARGIIAIPADNDLNREKAIALMTQHFPDGYIIEREWEQEIGEDTTFSESSHDRIRQIAARNEDDNKTGPNIPLTFGQHGNSRGIQSTRKAKEWRISYIKVKDSPDSGIQLSGHNRTVDASESVVPTQELQILGGPGSAPKQEPQILDDFEMDQAPQPLILDDPASAPANEPAIEEANPFEDPTSYRGRDQFQGSSPGGF